MPTLPLLSLANAKKAVKFALKGAGSAHFEAVFEAFSLRVGAADGGAIDRVSTGASFSGRGLVGVLGERLVSQLGPARQSPARTRRADL